MMTRPFPVLVRHFYLRLFNNDFIAFEDQMKEKTISFLALVSIFSAHVANTVLMKYMFVADDGVSWVEKCYFISFIMLLLGFITVFEWDVLFPDTRDFDNLLTLPVSMKMIFASKFSSLCLFIGIFALGANAIAMMAHWFYLIPWQEDQGILFSLLFILVHVVSLAAACFFVFFFFVFVIGTLMVILPAKVFRMLSLFLRTALMISCIFLMILVVSGAFASSSLFNSLPALKANQSTLFYLFPPMWFTGLYESLLGHADPQFRTCAWLALLSVILVSVGFFISAALGYRKFCKKTEARKQKGPLFAAVKKIYHRFIHACFIKNPHQRAVFHFVGKTLRHSMVHKMRLAVFAAVGISLEMVFLMLNVNNLDSIFKLDTNLLTLPMILTLFLISGMRNIVNIPISLEANWIFRLTEVHSPQPYLSGLRKSILFYILFPLFGVTFVLFSVFYGWKMGIQHSIYGIVVGGLIIEVFFLNYHKVPFACSYLPGKAKVHLFWLVYAVAFIVYTTLVGKVELLLLFKPVNFVLFLGFSFLVFLGLRVYQNNYVFEKWPISFEDTPEPALLTLLSDEN